MDPNQQPQQPLQPPQPVSLPGPDPVPLSIEPLQTFPQPAQPYVANQPAAPQAPSAYPDTPQPVAYDANYLDSIAPPPPRTKFLSGSFGKFFFILLGVFVLAVSLIIAFSGKDKTADLVQVAVRLDNFAKTTKTVQKNIKSNDLSQANTNLQIWITNANVEAQALLAKGGVKKTDYNKQMVASEKKIMTDLDAKFEDARLNATLDRVYASTMASETEKLIILYIAMSKKSASAPIRDYAKSSISNLTPIQKSFDSFGSSTDSNS